MRVEVYFNLHKKTFSVRSTKTGRVIKHTDRAFIKDPEIVVRKAGRERVLREGKKNVHAFVRGELMPTLPQDAYDLELVHLRDDMKVTYNPYKYDSFVRVDNEEPIKQGKYATLININTAETKRRSIYVV